MPLRVAECGLRTGLRAAFLALLLSVAVPAAVVRGDEVIDRILAVVGGEMITLTDVTAARDLGLIAPSTALDPIRAVLSRLIDRELILAEVDRYAPPEPNADAVDREVTTVRGRFATDRVFRDALRRSGIDEKHLRETVRRDLRIQAYLDQRFVVPPWSDEELGKYYREHLQAFTSAGDVPFEAVRAQIVQAATSARRRQLVDEWVAGLRLRGDVMDLYAAR